MVLPQAGATNSMVQPQGCQGHRLTWSSFGRPVVGCSLLTGSAVIPNQNRYIADEHRKNSNRAARLRRRRSVPCFPSEGALFGRLAAPHQEWSVLSPGILLIRYEMLRLIKREAGRRAGR
jgi:hypothetical protein